MVEGKMSLIQLMQYLNSPQDRTQQQRLHNYPLHHGGRQTVFFRLIRYLVSDKFYRNFQTGIF